MDGAPQAVQQGVSGAQGQGQKGAPAACATAARQDGSPASEAGARQADGRCARPQLRNVRLINASACPLLGNWVRRPRIREEGLGSDECGLAPQVCPHPLRGHNAVGLPSRVPEAPRPACLGKSRLHALQPCAHHGRTKGPRGGDGAGGAVPGDRRVLWMRMVPGEPCHRSAPAPASHAVLGLDRHVLLQIRVRVSQAHKAVALARIRGSVRASARLLRRVSLLSLCRGRRAPQDGSARRLPRERRGAQAERQMLPGAAVQYAAGAP